MTLTNTPHSTAHRADMRICPDCGSEYDALRGSGRTGQRTRCPELTWSVWDARELDSPAPDRERGIYEQGFPSKAAAQAAIPRLQASMAEVGMDIPAYRFVVVPDEYGR